MNIRTMLTAAALISMGATTAHAHLGHVAEVAGHSHWIGLAAVLGAAAIAGAIGILSGKESEDDSEIDTEAEGEAA
ncbi:MAG: DUF6732 family protein [Pikeienuella sp.]